MALSPRFCRSTLSTLLSMLLSSGAALASETAAATDPSLWGEEEMVYSATHSITLLKQAPVIASVITAHQIENMGARNLLDVLKHVPGIGVSIAASYGWKNIETRGVKSDFSGNVLMLLDGHALNEVYYGTAAFTYYDMPVSLIKRVEVIRSPGSVLYGTGAFGTVVNVITQENLGFNDASVEFATGTRGYKRSSVLMNSNHGELKLRSFVDVDHAKNSGLFVEKDLAGQSGEARDEYNNANINVRFSYGALSGQFGHQRLQNGAYIGVASALNQGSVWRNRHTFADLGYEQWINEELQFHFKVYADQNLFRTDWELLPAAVNPFFADSLAGKPHAESRIWGAEAQMDMAFSEQWLLTAGVAYEIRDLYDATRRANYDPRTIPYVYLGSEQDISDWANFTTLNTQYIKAFYMQNIYKFLPSFSWTLGARYDDYSNFGGAFNPRTAFVWNPTSSTAVKLMYGSAYRAPNFLELYITNNPVVGGNADLEPEKSETLELSLSHEFASLVSAEFNLFQTRVRDRISQKPTGMANPASTYVNKGGLDIEGVELELKLHFATDNYAYANYTFQDPRDSETDVLAGGISRHKANAGVNWLWDRRYNFNFNASAQGKRSRAVGDSRPPLEKYLVLDGSVQWRNVWPSTQLQLSVFNLTDETYFDPDRLAQVTSDFPREGRSMIIEIRRDLR